MISTKQHAEELGFEDSVEERLKLDVCDMTCLSDESFDAVVCYGGALSYVFDQAPSAMRECVRICRRGGYVLASVMSLWGPAHRYLDEVLELPPENNRKITETGDLTPENWAGVPSPVSHVPTARGARIGEPSRIDGSRNFGFKLSLHWLG